MGVVGLSFGSATSGKGFDVSTTVSQIMSNMQAVETPWKTQLTKLQSQDTEFSTLGTGLSKMLSALQNLTDYTAAFAGKSGSSSDTNVLQLLSANSNAIASPHTVVVTQLAQTETWASGYIPTSDTLSSGYLDITVGSTTTRVNVSDTDGTLSGMATAINRAGLGVTASILNGTTGSKLTIISNSSGSDGSFSVAGNITSTDNASTPATTTVSMSQALPGLDAKFSVDGVDLTSASNTVTNAIQGVSFQLLSTGSSTEKVQIQITNNTSDVETAIVSFVSDYNLIMNEINQQEGTDASGNAQPLYGNSVLSQIQQRLQSSLAAYGGSGSIKSLYELGITMQKDGTLSVNTTTLDTAVNSHFSDVASFFQDAGSFGRSLADTLNNLGSVYSTGLITLAKKEITSQETTLQNNIDKYEERMSIYKDNLTTQLNKANQTLQQIPDQLDYVNKIYSASTGYNTKS